MVAKRPSGPRGISPLTRKERDQYDNLILLCRVHHKLVDDQPNEYTVQRLKEIKAAHEQWVQERLQHTPPLRNQWLLDKLLELEENAGYLKEYLSSHRSVRTARDELYARLKKVDDMSGSLQRHSEVLEPIWDFVNTTGWILHKWDTYGRFDDLEDRENMLIELETRYKKLIETIDFLSSKV